MVSVGRASIAPIRRGSYPVERRLVDEITKFNLHEVP